MKKNVFISILLIISISLLTGCTENTDRPLVSAAEPPSLSSAPYVTAEAGTSKSYYTVEKNGRRGVVNERGQVVLPFEYSEINILYSGEKPAAFFVVPAVVKTGGQGSSNYGGVLLSLNGTPLYSGKCRYAYPVCDGLIELYGTDGTIGLYSAEKCGVISYEGKEIVPFRYDSISVCGDYIVAAVGDFYSVLDKTSEVDVYDKEGNLKNSGKFCFVGAGGSHIVVSEDTGKKFGLIDLNFNEVVPVEWDELNSVGSGLYIARRGEKYGVIDSRGKEVIPVKYGYPYYYSDPGDPDSMYFSITAEDGAYIYDGSGNILFFSDKFTSAWIMNGALIAQDQSGRNHYINSDGEDIIPPSDGLNVDVSGLIMCSSNSGDRSCYTKEGVKLPLPESDSISVISPQRFIYTTKTNWFYGICDNSGNILVPAKYTYMYPCYDKNNLIVFTETDKSGKSHNGVIDANDGSVLQGGFDWLYYAGGGLFQACKGSVHGIVDINGTWIWKTSDYQTLMD